LRGKLFDHIFAIFTKA